MDDTNVWQSIGFFTLVVLGISAVGLLFFSVA
jgi:hypothetical protein